MVLDYVSRPDVFAALWPPLVRGYCLDALEHETVGGPLDPAAWLETLLAAGPQWVDGPGLGSTITFASPTVGGAGLALEGQLVQLSAFAQDGDAPHAHRILRPSRRR